MTPDPNLPRTVSHAHNARGAATPIDILLVEDNPGDVRLTVEAFADATVPNRMHVAKDAPSALRLLDGSASADPRFRPDLILLDLNLPGMDGRDLLRKLKADTRLRQIPVVILTSSRARRDVLESYDSHANSYIAKPGGLDEYADVVRAVDQFWLTVAQLPPRGEDEDARWRRPT